MKKIGHMLRNNLVKLIVTMSVCLPMLSMMSMARADDFANTAALAVTTNMMMNSGNNSIAKSTANSVNDVSSNNADSQYDKNESKGSIYHRLLYILIFFYIVTFSVGGLCIFADYDKKKKAKKQN